MTIVSADTEKFGDCVPFSKNYQFVVVKAGVFVVSDGAYSGVTDDGYYQNTVENFGSISGYYGVTLTGTSDQLSNFAGAVIRGSYCGFYSTGSGNVVQNDGLIAASNGIVSTANTLTVINSGRIEASVYGVSAPGTGDVINNSGTIRGGTAAIYAYNNSALVLKNSGTLDGDVSLGNGVNRVTNTGTILGDVSLGAGGSTFNGRGGTVTGTVTGGTGADKLIAGNDGETLAGGGGHDTMVGGTGEDTFAFASFQPADSDIIHLFNVTEDTIQLDHTAFTKLAADKTPVFAIGTAATSAADHLFYNSATGALSYDVDGSAAAGVPRLIATLDTGLNLTAHNFTVV